MKIQMQFSTLQDMFDKMFIQLLSLAMLFNCAMKIRCKNQPLQNMVDKMFIQLLSYAVSWVRCGT